MSWVIFWIAGAMFTDGLIKRRTFGAGTRRPNKFQVSREWPWLLGWYLGGPQT
jgi:hypothetical protein